MMESKGWSRLNPILRDFPDEFQTDRLRIRRPRAGDGAEVNEAIAESLVELAPWMPFVHPLPSPPETEENVRRAEAKFLLREDLRMQLYSRATGRFLGSSGLHRINWDIGRFEIGYWIRSSEAGKGFVTEAVRGIVAFASQYLDAQRIEIRCDPRNERSRKVAERAGFYQEALLYNYDPDVNGEASSTVIYAILRQTDGSWGHPSGAGANVE